MNTIRNNDPDYADDYSKLTLLQRRWFPLWTLDRYILREFLIKYSVLLLVFTILFILSDVYQDISGFLEAKCDYHIIITYLTLKLPGNIRFILPISMLLGCMWTMATFGKNMEVTAMRASGVSLFRCGGPIFAVGLAAAAVNIYFNEVLVPVTDNKATAIYDLVVDKRRHSQGLLSYRSDDQQRRWLFHAFTSEDEQRDVSVKMFWTDSMIKRLIGSERSVGYAVRVRQVFGDRAEALLKLSPEKRRETILELMRGRKVDFYPSLAKFDRAKGRWIFKDGYFVSYDRNDETSFSASRGTIAMHPDIRFAEIIFSRQEIPETPDDIMNAVKEKDDLSTPVIWRVLHRNPNMAARVRSIYRTVFYYRLAFPWSCFLAVFLGIPLATKNERTGSLLAIITAVALIVVYIVVAQVFLVLGKGGSVNPVFAGLAPTVLFILCSAGKLITDRN